MLTKKAKLAESKTYKTRKQQLSSDSFSDEKSDNISVTSMMSSLLK